MESGKYCCKSKGPAIHSCIMLLVMCMYNEENFMVCMLHLSNMLDILWQLAATESDAWLTDFLSEIAL